MELTSDEVRARQATGAAAVASAMLATLPCIDANDPPKSLAAFRFYCSVLSCIGMLPEAPTEAFPLNVEVWVEDLLSHIFAVISNLDVPEHRGELAAQNAHDSTKETTFLLDSRSMFRCCSTGERVGRACQEWGAVTHVLCLLLCFV